MPTYSGDFVYDRYQFWEAKKTIKGNKVVYSTPKYCESKNLSDETVVDETLITAYPNPTKSTAIIEINESLVDVVSELQVYNQSGEFLFSQKIASSKVTLDLTREKSGIYLVKIMGRETNYSLKIIRE